MTNSQRLATVRHRLQQWIAEAGEGDANEPIIREAILIRDEFYVGRRFYTESHHAVWFIEEDELKIFGPDGQLACVLSQEDIDLPELEFDTSVPDLIKMPHAFEQPDGDQGDIRRAA